MKTEWICRWQYIPGHKKHFEVYPTLDDARRAMAKVLTDGVDLSDYIQTLREEEGEDCGSSADFLEKFLSDFRIPETEAEIPPHFDIPDHCLLEIYPDYGLRWEYARREAPSLRVSHPYYGDDGYPFVIDFAYENPVEIKLGRVNCVRIQMDERIVYPEHAYPFLVLRVLEEEPQNQMQIRKKIWEKFSTEIDRKTIGRHLTLLQNLGYPVQHNVDGYFRKNNYSDPQVGIKYGSSAYPLMILEVLNSSPKTQAAINRAVQEKYGAKMDRKTIIRNLDLLKELGFPVVKCDEGYYLNK